MAVELLFILIGLIIGAVVGWLACHSRTTAAEARVQMLTQQLEDQRSEHEREKVELRANAEKQQQQTAQQMELMRQQMNASAERILHERAQQLAGQNREQLGAILIPLQEKLAQMRDAVEKNGHTQSVSMERLDAAIKENLRQAMLIGERADRLAQALTGENKTQGNFGELRLRQMLEQMGLQEGVQFEEQTTMRDAAGRAVLEEDEGHRLIPDVILHFPDQRDVIIDSKVSLRAFEEYFEATDETAQEACLRRHIASLRTHVRELSRKNYSQYIKPGRQRLDFVMMYVFSESALQLAFSSDPNLWREAYDAGVIIVGSQTLYMMLRVLELTWRQVRHVENQEEIMRAADEVVNRVQLFYERFQRVDEQLHRTQDAFDELKRTTAPSGQSITTAAARLVRLGASENPKRKTRLGDLPSAIEEQ